MPKCMGNFERIAPTEQSEELIKLIGGQKMFGSTVKLSERIKLEGVRGIGSLPKEKEAKEPTPKVVQPRRAQAQPT